jgi:tRNA(Ile)-lysidine synthase
MYQQVKAYIEKYQMLKQKDKVIVGVSGGADSVCLLFMLLELQKEMELQIVAVHVHHGLRGETADADEAYVRELCARHQVELQVYHEDVKAYARQEKLTLEEAGRNVRRKIFEKVMQECQGDRIALAHHQNDNVETLLWNLCRGCGLKGVSGIAPVDGAYIRPLLGVSRKKIESYLEKRAIFYCTDETNEEDCYTRNRIRNTVIPYLEEQINEQAVAHMAETVDQMRELQEYVHQQTLHWLEQCTKEIPGYDGSAVSNRGNIDTRQNASANWLLVKEHYLEIPETLRSYVLQELLCRAAGHRKDIGSVHVRLLGELLEQQVGRQISLPYGLIAKRCYEGVLLTENPGETAETAENKIKVTFRQFDREPGEIIFPESPYTKWFDCDIINSTVKIRHREPGDYITINKDGGTQKLKQYFINEKIPADLRDEIWLAADGHHIMWIVGYRQNQMYQITADTRHILEIAFYGGEEDGRKC